MLKVNIQINLTLNVNEYFISIRINIQCLHTIMTLGHIYTNNLPLALVSFATVSKTHLLKIVV